MGRARKCIWHPSSCQTASDGTCNFIWPALLRDLGQMKLRVPSEAVWHSDGCHMHINWATTYPPSLQACRAFPDHPLITWIHNNVVLNASGLSPYRCSKCPGFHRRPTAVLIRPGFTWIHNNVVLNASGLSPYRCSNPHCTITTPPVTSPHGALYLSA